MNFFSGPANLGATAGVLEGEGHWGRDEGGAMETRVEDQLAALAAAPTSGVEPSGAARADELWTRGRARVRRRRVAQGVASLCAVAVVAGTVLVGAGSGRPEAVPVSAEHPAQLPATLVTDLPQALPDLPAGEVSAVGMRQRQTGHLWWSDAVEEVIGVSATTGRYGVLDLPGMVTAGLSGTWLSPDGASLAYWAVGESEKPLAAEIGGSEIASRVVVLDLVRGTRVEHDLDAPHGVRVGGGDSRLVWLDDQQVLVAPYLVDGKGLSSSTSSPDDWFVLDGSTGETQKVRGRDMMWPASNAVDGQYLSDRREDGEGGAPSLAVVDPLTGDESSLLFPDEGSGMVSQLIWDGKDGVAGLFDPEADSGGSSEVDVVTASLATGDVGGWNSTQISVPAYSTVVGWREGGVVVHTGSQVLVATKDAESRPLVRIPGAELMEAGDVQSWKFATDVVAQADVVPGVAPTRSITRIVAQNLDVFGAGVVLLALVAGLVLTARRSRGHA